MPLRGSSEHTQLVLDEALYFKTLTELDHWVCSKTHITSRMRGILPYTPRRATEGSSDTMTRGRLLVGRVIFHRH